jgi:glycosyltransferase involved in cell wall biosynthesis
MPGIPDHVLTKAEPLSEFIASPLWDEPVGLANVEGPASALPSDSTYGACTDEIVGHGGGIRVERGSAIQFASALRRPGENPELRTCVGHQGYAPFCACLALAKGRPQVEHIQKALSV